MSFEDALMLQGSLYENRTFDQLAVIQLDRLPGRGGFWSATLEPNGFRASDPGALAALSAGSEAVSYFWNVNADMRFLWLTDGQIRSAFDPLLEPEQAPVEAGPLPFEEEPRAAAMCLIETLTGVGVTREWFSSPKPTYLVSVPLG